LIKGAKNEAEINGNYTRIKTMKKWTIIGALSFLFIGAGFIAVRYYDYVFSRSVHGAILRVERVSDPGALIANGAAVPATQLFSFAVAIKDEKGEIHTASSEDRQWAVAQPGQCAEARFFPYPPWQFDKSGTYHGARLLKLSDCPVK
jgi:hypothetical protein